MALYSSIYGSKNLQRKKVGNFKLQPSITQSGAYKSQILCSASLVPELTTMKSEIETQVNNYTIFDPCQPFSQH